jgi:hypothetical protein
MRKPLEPFEGAPRPWYHRSIVWLQIIASLTMVASVALVFYVSHLSSNGALP